MAFGASQRFRRRRPLFPRLMAVAAVLTAAAPGGLPAAPAISARPGHSAVAWWDFEHGPGPGWRVQEGRWQVAGGALIHSDPFAKAALIGRPGEVFGFLHLTFDLRIAQRAETDLATWSGVLVGARHPVAEGVWGSGHLLLLHGDGRVDLFDFETPSSTSGRLTPAAQATLRQGLRPVRVELETSGSLLRVWAEGSPVLEHRAAHPIVGEWALAGQGVTSIFDNVRLRGRRVPLPPAPRLVYQAPVIPPAPAIERPVQAPLPRIAIRPGAGGVAEFYERETGARYFPEGWNYAKIGPGGWHALFNVGSYDPEEAERALGEMRALGANTVRVWAWGQQLAGSGHIGAPGDAGLNGAYLANFLDFLRRATRHRIHVLAVLDEMHLNAYYRGVLENTPSNDPRLLITGYNRRFFTRECIEVKRLQIEQFIGAIARAEPDLLPTVCAWQLQNEIVVNHSEGPFNRLAGWVKLPTGRRFNMGLPADRQAFYDQGIAHWADVLTGAVKRADPQALACASLWTADVHLRPPVNYLYPDEKDPRIPPRPSALAGRDCALDFIDVHYYAGKHPHLDPRSLELRQVRSAGKPLLLGEFGVYTSVTDDPRAAARYADAVRTRTRAWGIQGGLFFSWSLCEPEFLGLWCAQQDDLAWALRPIGPPSPAYWRTPRD